MRLMQALTKVITGAALAAAILLAAPQKAEAQRIGFGISIGSGPAYGGYGGYYGPRYVQPYPYGYGYPAAYGYGYPAYYGGYYGRPYYGRPAYNYGYRGGYRGGGRSGFRR